MLLICQINIFEIIPTLWINAAWMDIIALIVYIQAPIINSEKWVIPKLFITKNYLPHFSPRNTTVVPKSIPYSRHPKLSKSIVKYSYGGGARGVYLAHGLWGESTGPRWFPVTKASIAGIWSFLWSAPE